MSPSRTTQLASKLTAALAAALTASIVASAPAHGRSNRRVWCDMFHVAYAENTSCATEARVSKLYSSRCVPRHFVTGRLPVCKKTLLGFRCKPTGDIFAVINCTDARKRVGLHLAE